MSGLARSLDLRGRVALVTGASGWLGLPMAEGLAEAGAEVWLAARGREALEEETEHLRDAGHRVHALVMDVTDPVQVRDGIASIVDRSGRLDILVNNAHVGRPDGFDVDDDAGFARAAGQATTATWRLIHHALPLLERAAEETGDASIVNVSSMYGKVSPDHRVYPQADMPRNPLFYGAAKGGIDQMTRWLAAELGPRRIRVNTLSPGPFPQRDLPERNPGFIALLAERTPLGRIGRRDEVKGPLVFLASPAASYVTGTDLAVDGGWMAW
jgi:NAD(P)-dependent dehydrogenase (short-subunit alcohol dehydrogenase family)